MYLIRHGSRVCISTPAKLNFFLELHCRRGDGFHELETLMVPISLYDSLSVIRTDDDQIDLQCKWVDGLPAIQQAEMPAPENNIVTKALLQLRDAAGITDGATVQLTKRIPAQAGLGGGSSDAAAALIAANEVWKLNWSRQQLAEVGAQIGSDVPFFLFNSFARCTGRGEIIQPLKMRANLACVVVKPDFGLSTPAVFGKVQVPDKPKSSKNILDALANFDPRGIANGVFNRLQSAAASLTPWIDQISDKMDDLSVWAHQLSGSGTSYFAICRNKRQARHVAARLRATQLGRVFVVTTLGPVWAS